MTTRALMAMTIAPIKSNYLRNLPSSSRQTVRIVKPTRCAPLQQAVEEEQQVDATILCDSCNGKGWLLCDFCGGQKTNVKTKGSRVYRRCPSCRAIGYILCTKCKVYKCVTFPDENDGTELSF